MIDVRDLRLADPREVRSWAQHIADNMRQQDKDEVEASSGHTPSASLVQSILLSTDAFCILDRTGSPIAMFGAAPDPTEGVGVVWMLGTDGILKERHSIARQTLPYFERLHRLYHTLWNFIDTRNTVSLRWLTWAGFKLAPGDLRTAEGHVFQVFKRTRHV